MFVFQLEDLNFPEIKRKKQEERKEEDKKEFKELFELDTDSDEENTGIAVKGTAPGLGMPLLSGFLCDVGQYGSALGEMRASHVQFKR